MIGFDAIGRGAIGELAGGDDVVIFAPQAIAITATLGVAPAVHGGGSALPPRATVAATVTAPMVSVGASVAAPRASVTITSAPALVTHSATITAPANDVTTSSAAPSVRGGASIMASSEVVVTTQPAAILAGARIEVPSISVVALAAPAMVSAGAIVTVSAATVTALSAPADIRGGQYIEASNTVTMTTPYGEIGSASIGEFAIGEGEPSIRFAKRGVLVRVDVVPATIFAGKTVYPPPANINVTSMPGEIDSRLRRIRVHAIAS